MTKRILDVVTNVAHYDDPSHPTGLWLSELTHAWQVFEQRGFEQTIVSPQGGHSPLEPRSLKFPNDDATARASRADPARMALLEHTARPDEIDPADFDAIYFTGGHAVMFTSDSGHAPAGATAQAGAESRSAGVRLRTRCPALSSQFERTPRHGDPRLETRAIWCWPRMTP